MVYVYIPYGILAFAITIVIINSFKKVRENKKTNRVIRNSERFQNTISVLQARNKKERDSADSNE